MARSASHQKRTAGANLANRYSALSYAEGLWRMRRHGPVIAHCTDSEDFPRPGLAKEKELSQLRHTIYAILTPTLLLIHELSRLLAPSHLIMS